MIFTILQNLRKDLPPLFDGYWMAFTLAAILLCALPGPTWVFARVRGWLGRMARHATAANVAVFLLSLTFYVGWSLAIRMPYPMVHDEFSNLLAADTFAHGRLTNPTPVLWKHFETFHQIFTPTYASKFPPGEGLILAMGMKINGLPIIGVWLFSALACGVMNWALCQWIPRRWALIAMVLVVINPTVVRWSQNFMGGQLALLAGALVLGSARRVAERHRPMPTMLLATGLVLLAISRPYEGLVNAIAVISVMVLAMLRGADGLKAPSGSVLARCMIAPALPILLTGVGAIGYYNWRVTGNALQLPYALHIAQYMETPVFLFQGPLPAKTYDFPELAALHHDPRGLENVTYQAHVTWSGKVTTTLKKVSALSQNLFGYGPLPIGLLLLPWVALHDRRARLLGAMGMIFAAGLCLEIYMAPHYLAPGLPLLFAVLMLSLRHLNTWRRENGRLGKVLVHVVIVMTIACYIPGWMDLIANDYPPFGKARAELIAGLNREPDRVLIFVHYLPIHLAAHIDAEWVENGADPEHSKILWARDMGDEENKKLIEVYPGRTAWMLTYGDHVEDFSPYDPNMPQ